MRKTKTDEEIKSALARCGTSEYKSCEQCPYYSNTATCVERMLGDVLTLIERQQAEIKKWKTECGIFTLEREMYKGGSVEAVKRFAERLKGEMLGRYCMYFNYEITNVIVDKLVKEMVGDKNETICETLF